MSLTLVTSNPHKAEEVSRYLNLSLAHHSFDLDEIQEMNLEAIVEHKAHQAYQALKTPVIVEDVGFYIHAWGGFPGPFVKWLQQTMGYETLLSLLPAHDRQAEWVVAYGYHDGRTYKTFTGNTKGVIPAQARGKGWGFYTFLVPDGSTQTLAEMDEAEEARHSARNKALQQLKSYLSNHESASPK